MSISANGNSSYRPTLDQCSFIEERLVNYSKICLAMFALVFGAWIAVTVVNPRLVDPVGKPLGYDFIATWSAGHLAAEGRPADAYALQNIFAAHREAAPGARTIHPWPYPPTTTMLAVPFGLMPYPLALMAFMSLSLALWSCVIRRFIVEDERLLWPALAMPAGLVCFMFSQNGFISAGLMGLGLLRLDRRPWRAGFLLGLIVFKAHLGLLIPIALLAEKRWKTLAAAAAIVVALIAASLLAFGLDLWRTFFENLSSARLMIDAGWLPRSMIPTLYAFGLSVHLPPSVAMALQMAGALAAGAATWTVWRKDQASFNVKAAVLCTSSMMVSPYMFHYDFVMLGLAVGFLMREGFRTGYFSYEGPILLAVWILPALVIPAFNVLHVQLGAAIAIMMLGILVRRMGHPQSA